METITAAQIEELAENNLRELLAPYIGQPIPHTKELARKMVTRLRHAGLLRAAVTVTMRPDIQFQPED